MELKKSHHCCIIINVNTSALDCEANEKLVFTFRIRVTFQVLIKDIPDFPWDSSLLSSEDSHRTLSISHLSNLIHSC